MKLSINGDLVDFIGVLGSLASMLGLFLAIYLRNRKKAKQLNLSDNNRLKKKDSSKVSKSNDLVIIRLVIFWLIPTVLANFFIRSSAYQVLNTYWKLVINGVFVTFSVSIISIIIGTILGIAISLLITQGKHSSKTILASIIRLVLYILLSIPALVLLYAVYFSLNIDSIFILSVIALSINLMPFVAKIVANSIENISQDQIDAAKSFGYSRKQIAINFKIGYVIRSSLQPLLVEYYTTIKLSSLAGFISLNESFHVSQDIIKATQNPVSGYIILTLCYIVLVGPIAIIADYYERKWKSKQFG